MEASGQDSREVVVPPCISPELTVDRNRAWQLLSPEQRGSLVTGSGSPTLRTASGEIVRLVSGPSSLSAGERGLKVPRAALTDPTQLPDIRELRWIGDRSAATPEEVLNSLEGAFSFLEASEDGSQPGLRLPQLGAVHAVLGYWTTQATAPATVVMPTGTGKTETMVALFAAERPSRLLVVVPSDALRKQVTGKFETLGVLQSSGVIAEMALRPVVGQIDHRFSDADAARRFAEACNVIVTTPNALFPAASPEISAALLAACSHLFIDEAHHVEARTWRQIRDAFEGKPILQFTATPFREDGRRLAGRQVYRFTLRHAQELGYFSPIDYTSVVDLADQDRALATQAVRRLREDLDAGRDHVLMARVRSISRAEQVAEVYGHSDIAADLHPVVLHSGMLVRDRRAALDALDARTSRVIVCVDMLGEGFDLPSLKVAAIHDPHKSLGVTLQFVGRFARVAGEDIGRAAVFVGRPDLDYDHNLRRLFAEDADWNQLISDLTEGAVGEQEQIGEFEAGFGAEPDEVSIRSLAPKMSMVAYRTHCLDWRPEGVLDVHPEETLLTIPLPVNAEAHVTWFVVKLEAEVRWGDLPTVEEVTYHLYALYWDRDRQLLYINSSNTASHHEQLAKAVAGDDVERIRGSAVYRAMHGIQRLIPTNVGVLDVRDRDRRFSMYAGANVTEGFPTAEAQTKTQTNIFGSGFEEGERVTIGASLKGRVWSYRVAHTLKHWVDWCDHVGPKLADESISVDDIKGAFILPEILEELPQLVPIALEWPLEAALSTSEERRVEFNGASCPVADVDLRVAEFTAGGPIAFEVHTPEWNAAYTADVENKYLVYRPAGDEVLVKRARLDAIPLSEYFATKSSGPLILFEQDAVVLHPGLLLKPGRELPPYSPDDLQALDWDGINIRKESQGRNRDADSIQARTIQHVCGMSEWGIVLDDDQPGETADVVAIRVEGDQLHVMLVHCKYSTEDDPGARVEDLYDVCGQAQKSARSRHYVSNMFRQLIRRERNRVQNHSYSGFEHGDIQALYELHDQARMLRPSFTIAIAQPGLSKAGASCRRCTCLLAPRSTCERWQRPSSWCSVARRAEALVLAQKHDRYRLRARGH